ncbi:DUF1183-domain-containing protein [Lentinula raphanica]|nr:DUF1183-domain-containing protein [Lentinula raphanica]
MSRVKLASIKALTFYKDETTAARRTRPIQQLVCVGKPCKAYQPEVVRCKNIDGTDLDVDWKCEADLPEALRFGKVMVSCEGWSGPGDPYVLKDSCSLEYRLVEVPRDIWDRDSKYTSWKKPTNIANIAFMVAWVALLLFICYSLLKSCLRTRATPSPSSSRSNPPGGRPGPGGGNGRFPGSYDDDTGRDPPPPYTKTTNDQLWRPGFWTGAIVGGLANQYLFRNNNNNNENDGRQGRQWDWERNRRPASLFGGGPSRRTWFSSNSDDRGEGSSNLGNMRRSTGFGGSNVR